MISGRLGKDSRLETKDFVHIVQEVQSASDRRKTPGPFGTPAEKCGPNYSKQPPPFVPRVFRSIRIFALNQLIFPA